MAGKKYTEQTRTAQAIAALSESDQTVSSADASATLQFDTRVKTTEAIEIDLSNNEMKILQPGIYTAVAHVLWKSDSSWSTGDFAAVNWQKNGLTWISGNNRKIGTEKEAKHVPTGSEVFHRGDTTSVNLFQDSGSSVLLSSRDSPYRTKVSVTKIGPY